MRINLPSGINMEIIRHENGVIDVNCTAAPRTYNSVEEFLQGRYNDIVEILTAAKKEGIFNGKYYDNGNLARPGKIPARIAAKNNSGQKNKYGTKPDTGYTWTPSAGETQYPVPPIATTYGVTPLPGKNEQTPNVSENAPEANPYQRLIPQPDAASHAPIIHLHAPPEEDTQKSSYEYANELSEAGENFTNMGEAGAEIFRNEELTNRFGKAGDYLTFGRNIYMLTHANNIYEQNKAFGNTLKNIGRWWAKREIPYVGEGLLAYDIGKMFYSGIRYDLIPGSQRMAYYDAENRYEIEYANDPLSSATQYWHDRVEELKKYAGYLAPVQAKFERHDPNRFTDSPNGR